MAGAIEDATKGTENPLTRKDSALTREARARQKKYYQDTGVEISLSKARELVRCERRDAQREERLKKLAEAEAERKARRERNRARELNRLTATYGEKREVEALSPTQFFNKPSQLDASARAVAKQLTRDARKLQDEMLEEGGWLVSLPLAKFFVANMQAEARQKEIEAKEAEAAKRANEERHEREARRKQQLKSAPTHMPRRHSFYDPPASALQIADAPEVELEPVPVVEIATDACVAKAEHHMRQGRCREAFELLSACHEPELVQFRATTMLGLGLQTDDADLCDKALQDLVKAKFSLSGGAITANLSAYGTKPQSVRLCANHMAYANSLGKALIRQNRLPEAVTDIYEPMSLVPPKDKDARKVYMQVIESSGDAFFKFACRYRDELGAATVAQGAAKDSDKRIARINLSNKADKYFQIAFERYYLGFQLKPSDYQLRNKLAESIARSGDPDPFQKLEERIHRRQKGTAATKRWAASTHEVLMDIAALQAQGRLLPEEHMQLARLREHARHIGAKLRHERQKAGVLDGFTTPREVRDRPGRLPAQARSTCQSVPGPR